MIKKILLYCTGGIRCEKASAYLKHHGYADVNQLHGGILEYVRQVKAKGIQSRFVGKNFVFDERMGESVDGRIISKCHQCGVPCDTHVNCNNELCHILFIQCSDCAQKMEGCCTTDCVQVKNGTEKDRLIFRKKFNRKFGNKKQYRKSFLLVNKG